MRTDNQVPPTLHKEVSCMKVSTKVRAGQGVQYAPPAGDRCHTAFYQLLYSPTDGNLQRQFCDCCARDPNCLL